MHAHTDLDAPEVFDGISLNDLTGYTTNGSTTFGISIFNPSMEMHRAIVQLTEQLKAETHRLAKNIWDRYMKKDKVPNGVTLVNMALNDGPFLVVHPGNDTKQFDEYYVDVAEFKTKGRTRRCTTTRRKRREGDR